MQQKTERFEMRLEQDTLDRVDAWRGNQDGLPSRAEAIRRLVEIGLASTGKHSLAFSDGEKLILYMLSDMYKNLKIKGEFEPQFIQSAIAGGHFWGLKWDMQGIFHGHSDSEVKVSFVGDVLDMWSFIEWAYRKMSPKEKAYIKANAEGYGDAVVFPGFDGNYEGEYLGIARFMIEEMDRFADFKGRGLNSHFPCVSRYQRMLNAFLPIRNTLVGRGLSSEEIVKILSIDSRKNEAKA